MSAPCQTKLGWQSAWFCLLATAGWVRAEGAAVPPNNLPVLINVEQVRQLTPEEAKRRYPVKVRGVVTHRDAAWGYMFIQDSTAGIFVWPAKSNLDVQPGELAEVTGYSAPGDFAPMIDNAQVEKKGLGQLPVPLKEVYEHLMSGKEDSQWVELRGVVRSVSVKDGHLLVNIATTGGRFDATIPDFEDKTPPAGLVDAAVRIRGACGTVFNQKRQLVGIKLFTQSLKDIIIEEPAPDDPFTLPVQKIGGLLQFNLQAASKHRVRVQGVVTHRRGNSSLYIQDETGALQLSQVEQITLVKTGERLDIVGFEAPGALSVILQNPTVRRIGSGTRPVPVRTTARELQQGVLDSELVQVEALLIDCQPGSFDHSLAMQSGRFIFNASLENSKAGKKLLSFRPGSRLQLTGVCSVQVDEFRQPRSFRLLLESPEDIQILATPTWWTFGHAMTALGLMGVVVLAVLEWVIMLRRRVREQTELICQRLEHEAALEQRYRQLVENARDIVYSHDLAGNFTSLNKAAERVTGFSNTEALQLNLTQVVAPKYLEQAQQLIRCRLAEELPAAVELEIVAKDGNLVPLEVCPRLIQENGKVLGIEGIARDITERKRAEQALRESKAYLSAIIESEPECVKVVDMDGTLLEMNQAGLLMIEAECAEAVIGHCVYSLITPEYRDQFIAFNQRVCQGQRGSLAFEIIGLRGTRRWMETHAVPMPNHANGKLVHLAVTRDCTERKRVEEALRKSEAMFNLISTNVSDLIAVVDATGKRLYNSPSYGKILGDSAKLAGTNSFEQIHPEDRERVKRVFLETIRTEVGQRIEYRFLLPDGSVRHIESQGNFVRGDAGEPGKVVVISRDITERKRADEALKASEQLNRRILESVPGGIVHVDRDGAILRANGVAQQVLGIKPDELANLRIADIERRLIHENGRELDPQDFPISKCLCTGAPQTPITLGVHRFDQGTSWAIFTALPLGDSRTQTDLAARGREGEGQMLCPASAVMTFVDITERKRAEEALRQSHERFELIGQGANDGFWDWNIETNEIYFSPRYKSMLGYAEDEIKNRFEEWERLMHPEDREQAKRMIKAYFDRQVTNYEFEHRLLHKDGTYRWILARGIVLRRANGQPYRMAGAHIDLTERKRAEDALRETESLYHRAIAAADSVAYRRDYRNDSFSFIGPEINQMTGYSAQEMTPKLWESLVQETIMRGEAAGMLPEEAIRRTRAGEFMSWRDDCRITTRSGQDRWIADTSLEILDPQGEPIGSIGILQDITERKRAEEALRKSEELFSKAFRASPIPISISTEQGRYLDVNDSFLRLLGFSRDEVIGHSSLELGIWEHPEDRTCVMQKLREKRSVREIEIKLRTKSGQFRNVHASFDFIELGSESGRTNDPFSPLTHPEGHTILSILHDVTERQNLEAQLRQSQKMESVGQLAGGIAHDFNNILTIIQGHVSLLLDGGRLEPVLRNSANQISQASDRAANLTRQLLAFGRRQFLQPTNLDLSEVVAKMSQMLQRVLGDDVVLLVNDPSFSHFHPAQPQTSLGEGEGREGGAGDTLTAQETPMIRADAGMIDQILLNLAVNSRDAMPRGGRLTISTEVVAIDEDYVRQNPDAATGDFVCLSFNDSGCGIAPEHLPHLFEPFFTTKDVGKGTGLGLATVYGIVKQHQGWIKVASELGRGTTFQIFLPKSSVAPEKIVTLPSDVPVRGGAETILVVEDEATVRKLVLKFLDRLGYKPLEARSGVAALKVWQQHQNDIDLLLTDMVMPDGMSGRELAENLRGEKPHLKVVYTSGYSAETVGKNSGLREGLNFLQKPYHPRKLAQIIRDSLDRSAA